jgi:peptide deformylase
MTSNPAPEHGVADDVTARATQPLTPPPSVRQKYLAMLRTFDDPALKVVCEPLTPGEDRSFLRDMRRVCMASPDGVGLAAPQIGISKRAVFLWPSRAGWGTFMLNPKIGAVGGGLVEEREACLSYPGVWAPVKRWLWITVEWLDEHWMEQRARFTGFDARLAQNECDHLEGVCRVGEAWRAREVDF